VGWAIPAGLHRRFAPTHSLVRVLREQELTYGLLLNAFERRLVCTAGALPSHIGFDLTAIAEGGDPGLQVWKLPHALINQSALAAEPPLLDRVRKIGGEHQLSVSTMLDRQVQSGVRLVPWRLRHMMNPRLIPSPEAAPWAATTRWDAAEKEVCRPQPPAWAVGPRRRTAGIARGQSR